jgi:hypothetical protein
MRYVEWEGRKKGRRKKGSKEERLDTVWLLWKMTVTVGTFILNVLT